MKATQSRCRFCEIIGGAEQSRSEAPGVVSFPAIPESLPGHLLVIPVRHVADALEDPALTGRVFEAAARAAVRSGTPCNLATNVGADAGQVVGHFHVHVLPRTSGGALEIPRGELLYTAGLRSHASLMWRWQNYRNAWIRWWAWRARNSPAFRTCQHGRHAGWDQLDGGWWHVSDWSTCEDDQSPPPAPRALLHL